MHWIAPQERDAANDTLEKRQWAAADQLRANSGFSSAQYSQPVLGLIFLRFAHLIALPEGGAIGQAVNDAMRAIERDNPQLAGGLPRTYEIFSGTLRKELLNKVSKIPASLVRLRVEVLEPYHGLVLDPACGSGGMFVQSARFVSEHRRDPGAELSIHGQEKVSDAVKLYRKPAAVEARHSSPTACEERVSRIKSIHGRTWHPAEEYWTVPNDTLMVERL